MNEITPEPASVRAARPSPYTDRRALSEAWYRALYGGSPGGSGAVAANGAHVPFTADVAAVERNAPERPVSSAAKKNAPALRAPHQRKLRVTFAAQSRVFAAKSAARQPQRVANRSAFVRRTLCRVPLPDGQGIDLLVQQRGDVLRLIAIYDGRSAQRVAAALHRARTALLLRGVNADIDSLRKGSS